MARPNQLPPGAVAFLVSPFVNRAAIAYSVVQLAVSVPVAVSAFLFAEPPVPFGVVIILFVAAFPLAFRTAGVVTSLRAANLGLFGLLRRTSPLILVAAVADFVAFAWALGCQLFGGDDAGPAGHANGHYFLSEHGPKYEVTKSVYYSHLASLERVFALAPIWFALIGLGLSLYLRNSPSPRDEAD